MSGAADARAAARFGPLQIGALVVIAAAFVALFYRWFEKQLGPSGFSARFVEDWGHAYVVPLISGYYVWTKRHELLRHGFRTYWPGLAVLVLAVLLYVYFIAGYSNHMFQGFSIVLAIAGLTMLLLGPRAFRTLAFPIAYLSLGVTISEMVMNKITWQLKLLASQGSYVTLNMIGVETDIRGNILEIYPGGGADAIPLNVADACSGMRMVVAFIALGVAVAFLSCKRWWQRIALLMLAVPVALIMNIVRVTVLGVLSLVDESLAVGEAHTLIGTLLLLPAFGLFMGCVWALNRIFVSPDDADAPQGAA